MSATSTPNDSPVVQPLHNPANAAHVVVPQAPLGNVVNQVPGAGTGLGAKALLAKKMANQSAAYHSPTDNLMTPVTRKLSAAKKKHFSKGPAKSAQLFAQKEENSSETEEQDASPVEPTESDKMELDNDDENPF